LDRVEFLYVYISVLHVLYLYVHFYKKIFNKKNDRFLDGFIIPGCLYSSYFFDKILVLLS